MRTFRMHWLVVAITLLGLFSLPASAVQAARKPAGAAELRLTIGSRGNVTIHFIVFTLPPKLEALESLTTEALGTKLRAVDWDIDDHKEVTAFSADTVNRFARHAFRVHGQADLAPLEKFLAELKVPSFTVRINHPRAGFSHCAMGHLA